MDCCFAAHIWYSFRMANIDENADHPLNITGELGGRDIIATGPEGPLQALVLSGDLNELDLDKKRLLAAFLEYGVTKEAFHFTGITQSRHNRWLRTNVVYSEAVKALGNGLLLEASARLDAMYPKAADALEDALDAEKAYPVTCPACNHHFSVPIADLKLRVDVAKSLFTRAGEMGKTTVKVSGEVTHTTISMEDRLALAQLERGLSVPAHIVSSLRQRGLLPTEALGAASNPARDSQSDRDEGSLEGQYRLQGEGPA